MKIWKFLFFIVGLISIFNIYMLSSQTKWLVKKNYFPIGEDKNGYKALIDLEIIEKKIVILENIPGYKIHVFSKKGKLIKSMGGAGKEPGKLVAPVEISSWKDEIAVKDNRGVSIFKMDGSFVRRFNPFVNIVSFVYIDDKIYVITATPGKQSLIDVYSSEGKFLYDFGKGFFKLDYSKYKHVSQNRAKGFVYEGKLLSDGKYLYYLNSTFGKVLVFTMQGEKTGENNISSIFGEKGEEVAQANKNLWLEEGIDLKKTNRRVPSHNIFYDASISGDRIYIIPMKERYKNDEIKVLDAKSFELVDSYKIKKEDNEGILALTIVEENQKPIFHLTLWAEDKASVYTEYTREK